MTDYSDDWSLDTIPLGLIQAALNRRLAKERPKPKKLAPCVGCRALLGARERRGICPVCGSRNPRDLAHGKSAPKEGATR